MRCSNFIKCSGCGFENHHFSSLCNQCGATLRDKVVNIDLWHTIWLLFETPLKAFQNIIFSENKNFIVMLSVIIPIKMLLNSYFIINFFEIDLAENNPMYISMIISLIISVLLLTSISFINKFITNLLGIKSRFTDTYALIIYAFMPILFSLVILFPVQYALFGQHWFYFNPSPFFLKEKAAYVLIFLEVILLIWTIILISLAFFAQTKCKGYSLCLGILIPSAYYAAIISSEYLVAYIRNSLG